MPGPLRWAGQLFEWVFPEWAQGWRETAGAMAAIERILDELEAQEAADARPHPIDFQLRLQQRVDRGEPLARRRER